ncbi:flagellar hook assembly protein FlgD [Sphingomonas sp. ST-64]|uniref:Basal-body rod modification protein FlgD n=1 Tax=Sphingomonas plantiphila TaxID=3163295 RepID=A0ABW8YR30_9SPHN
MAVDTISGSGNAATTQSSALSKLATDSTMFLRLLTTQMQNQDPLDPMDTSEYTAQLVQFSQVEQSIQQNATLKSILSALSSDGLLSAAPAVGKIGNFASSDAGLTADAPARWSYVAERPTGRVIATILDASGKPVHTIDRTDATGEISWDGTLADGNTAPPGIYTLSITATDAAGGAVPVGIFARGTVREITQDASGMAFMVNGVTYGANMLLSLATE